ncbi:MAG: hypothetical protein ABII79_00740 [bacterium]
MTDPRLSVGVDLRRDGCYLARVQHDGNGYSVVSLDKCKESELEAHLGHGIEVVVLSVPDEQVLVRSFRLDRTSRWDSDLLTRFELSRSLLDDDNEFSLVGQPAGNGRHLGLAVRCRQLQQLADLFPFLSDSHVDSLRFEMRAVALARAYRCFCRVTPGELVGLADFGRETVSLCFLRGEDIIDVTGIRAGPSHCDGDRELRKMAAEFKTVVNFRLATLQDNDRSPLLSSLLITGVATDSPVVSILEDHFSKAVRRPQINPAFLKETSLPEGGAADFLIAMGLAVS